VNNLEFAKHLQERLLGFAKKVNIFCQKLYKLPANRIFADQLNRSASSIGANYIEANESLGKKDFYHKLRICRKESKESCYWLEIIESSNSSFVIEARMLKSEADEYLRIFSSVLNKLDN